jgi:type I restriction enzyme R subunit
MQTIARANRVFKEKVNGLIVDYVGVFRNLEKALAIYGAGGADGSDDSPVKDKEALVALLRQSVTGMEEFCGGLGVALDPIEAATGFEQIKRLDDAVEVLIVNDGSKKRFLTQAGTIMRLYKAILPDSCASALAPRCLLVDELAKKIRALMPRADISDVMAQVEALLDESIDAEGYVIRETPASYGEEQRIDLAQIDFEALKEKFAKGRKRTEAEKLKGLINSKLKQMLRLNRTRMDYLERFQEMIDEYNSGSLNIDEFFARLMAFADSLNDEEKRAVAEQLSEEELALFDILAKSGIKLTDKEIKLVKKAARDLLETLKHGKLVLDWRKFQQPRAAVKISIEDVLDEGLPESFTPELFQQKVESVYQHVFDSYYGGNRGVYVAAP